MHFLGISCSSFHIAQKKRGVCWEVHSHSSEILSVRWLGNSETFRFQKGHLVHISFNTWHSQHRLGRHLAIKRQDAWIITSNISKDNHEPYAYSRPGFTIRCHLKQTLRVFWTLGVLELQIRNTECINLRREQLAKSHLKPPWIHLDCTHWSMVRIRIRTFHCMSQALAEREGRVCLVSRPQQTKRTSHYLFWVGRRAWQTMARGLNPAATCFCK